MGSAWKMGTDKSTRWVVQHEARLRWQGRVLSDALKRDLKWATKIKDGAKDVEQSAEDEEQDEGGENNNSDDEELARDLKGVDDLDDGDEKDEDEESSEVEVAPAEKGPKAPKPKKNAGKEEASGSKGPAKEETEEASGSAEPAKRRRRLQSKPMLKNDNMRTRNQVQMIKNCRSSCRSGCSQKTSNTRSNRSRVGLPGNRY